MIFICNCARPRSKPSYHLNVSLRILKTLQAMKDAAIHWATGLHLAEFQEKVLHCHAGTSYIYINCLESICVASGKTRLSMLLDGPTKLDSTWRRLVRTASRAKSAVCHVQHHILRLHEL